MLRFALIVIASTFCLAAQPASAKSSVYVSLMGEPFRTNEAGEDPFDQWFGLADLDGDGAISRLEFRQDAEAFFARLDPNDDKIIDADEMREYEHLAPGRTRAAAGGAQAKGATSDRTKGPGELEREKGHVPIVADGTAPTVSRVPKGGSGPITLATNVPQPVAMADLNIDRRVTLDEFTKTASRRFTNYDQDQDGRLTRKELAGTTR
jgi:Ca2+-binding EF-hand superfamily protein